MTISQAQLRRLERLERAQAQPRDIGTCPAPPLSPERLRVVLRMLAEVGGLHGERCAAVRAALDAAQQEDVGEDADTRRR